MSEIHRMTVVLGLVIVLGPADLPALATQEAPMYERVAVAADHPLASQAGARILKEGGNVVDAAVATSFALSVVRPSSCGIGGGGFMVIWNAATQQSVVIDYRERAPVKATRDMFQKATVNDVPASRKGHLAAAIPGTVAGLCEAHRRYGKLPLKTVLAPAIELARDGFEPDAHQRQVQASALKQFRAHPGFREKFAALREKYLNGGEPWKDGDRFRSPQLAVLERIAEHGADGFYRGPVAAALLAESRRGGGIWSPADFENVAPVIREPLRGRFEDVDVITMPPPSSGGTAILQTLNAITTYEKTHPQRKLERLGLNSPGYTHLVTEALKHAFADRAEHLGDADFVEVPVARLISDETARQIAAEIDWDQTQPAKAYGAFQPVEDNGTSHFSIIDAAGNAVACTETINTTFGSYVVEPRFGIVLNSEMDDFAAVPGQPNAFGLMQSEQNAVAPRKKPLSSMSPTILVRNGRAVGAVGASGGPRIISGTLQVLIHLTRFDLSPREALAQPRLHHQWLPHQLYLEPDLFRQVGEAMQARGHEVRRSGDLAAVQAVLRTEQGLYAASDPRKGGKPAGE